MKLLVVSGYVSWDKISKGLMPSHHLYGVHEMIDHYENNNGQIRGYFKKDIFIDGYIDFYLWNSGKKNIIKQTFELLKLSKQYDLVYDILNRCSIYLGFLKKFSLYKTKLVTVLHHPPYRLQLKNSNSDAYIFFDKIYLDWAIKECPKKKNIYFINKWGPDKDWYDKVAVGFTKKNLDVKYIDTGKSKRDRDLIISVANETGIRIDYAGDIDQKEGMARSYKVDLSDDIGMVYRILQYNTIIIPVQKCQKELIGPLGVTSFLDCLALHKPIIVSDNVFFAKEVEDNNIGLVYKTGDQSSFKAALNKLSFEEGLYERIQNRICNYTYPRIEDYSKRLLEIIHLVYDRKE